MKLNIKKPKVHVTNRTVFYNLIPSSILTITCIVIDHRILEKKIISLVITNESILEQYIKLLTSEWSVSIV